MGQRADRAKRVLIVDPMPLARKALTDALRASAAVEVVGVVSGPQAAERRLVDGAVDVVLLDVEPPVAPAIEHLRRMRAGCPFDVVLFTGLDGTDRQAMADAFAVPASSVIVKPASGLLSGTQALQPLLLAALTGPAQVRQILTHPASGSPAALRTPTVPPPPDRVVAIGASTGGTEALVTVLGGLPRLLPGLVPGLVIVQHMPPGFTAAFARRLDQMGDLRVKEAEDGDAILPGRALLAPGARHLAVQPSGAGLVVRVDKGEPVNGHCPSVDVLMLSVARHVGRHAIGVLLTGMGNDGALGMCAIREAGGVTIGQDKATSTVYGMPRTAWEAGGVAQVAPLPEIAGQIAASVAGRA